MTTSKEHENWIRYHCVDQARQLRRFSANVDEVLADAKKLAQFVLNRPDAEVVSIVKKEEGK